MSNKESKITRLEEEFAHVTLANEELSSELIHCFNRIEQLERRVAMLESRFSSLEDNIEAPLPNEKPPHW